MSKILVIVSVDWEGRSLLTENLDLIAAFRRQHPDVPMQHFINPAYYTRTGIDAEITTQAITRVLLPDDDHGMHIHPWHSLLSAAGVAVRDLPTFVDADSPVPRAPDDWGFYPAEAGYDTSIEGFEFSEVDRIIQTSANILTAAGFRNPVSFRAGGWLSGPKVQSALAKNGFLVDCSAVDSRAVTRRFGDIPLSRWLRQLWPTIDQTSQPFRLSTPFGQLWEVPNNATLIDYLSAEEILELFECNVARWQEAPDRPWFFSTGFHQETARTFLGGLDETVSNIKRLRLQQQLPVIFTAKPQEFVA